MNVFKIITSWFRSLTSRQTVKREIDEELRFHLDQRTVENIAKGMSAEDAAREARKRFGNLQSVREECREKRGANFGETTWQDVRFGLRMLKKNPGFTLVAVLTLALGIGANTAIFSIVDKLLVRPLPVSEPQRLALVGQARSNGNVEFEFNYPLFCDYQRENTVFSQLEATGETDVGLATGRVTERQRAMVVSGNYFTMLGVNAAIGRTFGANEGVEIDDAPVVVLSHGLWRRSFNADPQVIGRSVTINGHPYTIIGVTPREFTGTSRATVPDLYLPMTMYGQLTSTLPGGEHPLRTRYVAWHYVLGRLKEGVSHAQAQAAMQVLTDQFNLSRQPNTPERIAILPGDQGFTHDLRDTRLPLKLLLGTAGLVLLIACANLANLQLARATSRTRDFAVRLALGAGRVRLIRQLLTESVLLALSGGLVGIAVAFWLVNVLDQFRPRNVSLEMGSGLDLRVLLFAFGASVFTGVLFGLAPAWRASRPQILPELKGGGGTTESRTGPWNLRGALVVLQVALSLVVLVGAGLCLRSLMKLQRLDAGFRPSGVVLMSFDLGLNNYSEARANEFYDQMLERVRTLPGIEAASFGVTTPLSGSTPGMSVERAEGYEPPNARGRPWGDFNIVASDYFRVLGVPMIRGRDFNGTDTANGPAVVIVNEAFAKRYWPGQDALGKRIFQHGPNGGTATEVIGVVGSMQHRRLNDSPRSAFFFPNTQKSDRTMTLAVRTGLDSSITVTRLRELVKSFDANLPVLSIRTLEQQKDDSLALERMAATFLAGFGVLALALAALGIYGVLAYTVSRRTREIGVRMALGAQVVDVLRLVLRQGIGMTLVGLVIGLGGAFAATRLLRGFLYEVKPLDALTFVVVIVILALVALAACWLPARRAAKVNPMVALRHE